VAKTIELDSQKLKWAQKMLCGLSYLSLNIFTKKRKIDQVCLRRGRGKTEIIKKKNNQRFPREKKLVKGDAITA